MLLTLVPAYAFWILLVIYFLRGSRLTMHSRFKGEIRELSRDCENTAAYYSTICMNGIVLIAGCLFAGFFLGEGLRLSRELMALLQKSFELTR
jgi:hypothetical protein